MWLDDAEHQQCAAAAPLGAELGAVLGADLGAVLGADAPVVLIGGGGGGGSGPLSAFQGLWRQLGVDKELGNALERHLRRPPNPSALMTDEATNPSGHSEAIKRSL
jgi:hypothetical protein